MAVHSTLQAFLTAVDAAIPRDADPLQQQDITEWDTIRQLLSDLQETSLDSATMQAVVLTAGIIAASMLAENSVTANAIAANAVQSGHLDTDGAGNIAPAIRVALESLTGNNKAPGSVIRDGTITATQLAAAQRVAAWARAANRSGRMPQANATANTFVDAAFANNIITFTQADGTVDVTIDLSGLAGGGTSPTIPTHQIYAAYASDNNWQASEFTGTGTDRAGTTNGSLTLSGATGRAYIAIWSAEQLTVIDPVGRLALPPTDNDIANYTESRLTISSTNGYLYTNTTDAPAGYINGAWRFA